MAPKGWTVHNPDGDHRVIVTKDLPGRRWLDILTAAGCRVEVCTSDDVLTVDEIAEHVGVACDGVIGQLTEDWNADLFGVLAAAGVTAYSNYAVGYNNVDVAGATAAGIPVGNTPGVLTETTAEMALALTFSAGRRVVEADRFMRGGAYHGWLPTMFMGKRFHGGTVGIVGAGRIGAAYGRMMVEGHKMNLVYFDLYPNETLERYIEEYSAFLVDRGEAPVTCSRTDTIEELLALSDIVSLHTVLDDSTHHLINAERLAAMKPDAILVNSSRGPIIDEAALVEHCRAFPLFTAGLDVFEDEPAMKPGLADLDNVVIVPHIASATNWTREGMATLAAANVAAILQGYPLWTGDDVLPFLSGDVPETAPSIVNAAELELH
ncbi:MAG: NAD(P)-dependent oxidoreductase [Actinomycetota bacterium]|nr:NAD(P)-dependent oxidoreductase [Actinomycetota bacterium]MDK1026741.1 NAD(P)-dependent oxidoreductase [Actinomycetota bacterium]MDK1096035.1 NAD(P)-dependent oxidoreductase [Actinomycetota bacterium]MDK1103330.1 NAD(P)-dependent oxidoreductase [Actinomycetota bacterium]